MCGRSVNPRVEWSGVEEISGVLFLGRRVWTCPGRIQCVQYHKCVYGERRAGTRGTLSHSCLAILILHISRRTSMGHILQRRRTHLFRSNKAEGLAGYFIINNYEFICWKNRCQGALWNIVSMAIWQLKLNEWTSNMIPEMPLFYLFN